VTFTYLTTDLSTDLAKVRREIADTNEDDQFLQDEEINSALASEVTVLLAAAKCCDWISRTFARDFDFEADGTRVMKAARAKQYRELASDLRERAAVETSGTGGIGVVMTRNVDGYQPASSPTVDHADLTPSYVLDW
jgi:hypothetical protein